jgi:hypothetical protein
MAACRRSRPERPERWALVPKLGGLAQPPVPRLQNWTGGAGPWAAPPDPGLGHDLAPGARLGAAAFGQGLEHSGLVRLMSTRRFRSLCASPGRGVGAEVESVAPGRLGGRRGECAWHRDVTNIPAVSGAVYHQYAGGRRVRAATIKQTNPVTGAMRAPRLRSHTSSS